MINFKTSSLEEKIDYIKIMELTDEETIELAKFINCTDDKTALFLFGSSAGTKNFKKIYFLVTDRIEKIHEDQNIVQSLIDEFQNFLEVRKKKQ